MSIDDAIERDLFFACCVLPLEFDAERNRISFAYVTENNYSSTEGIQLDVSPFTSFEGSATQPATSQQAHAHQIRAALKAIGNGTLQKVVVSCIKHAPRNSISVETIFQRLIERYPNAFVYIIRHPYFGLWMGATPELLLHKHGTAYRTVSLAGTQPFREAHSFEWSDKLKHEQQLVTDFILEHIRLNDATDVELKGPYTAQAGPLAHLKTDIRFQSNQSSQQIIDALQPTPAVCGLPREAALDFIQTNADFERRLYAGRIGLHLPTGDEIHFVNLRCMQVFDDHFELHVGGGIVAGSTAEEEWNETEIKANVLRNLIQ
ncbi:MAG: chorismate-binding protein [Flavobacteriales bacterium]|jgi:isochorismate synthase